MSCKLYIKTNGETFYAGEFRNQEAAKKHYDLLRPQIRTKPNQIVKLIIVETGKGRGRK